VPSVFEKLNLRHQSEIFVSGAPASFEPELKRLSRVSVIRDPTKAQSIEFAILFVTKRAEVESAAKLFARKGDGDVVLWFAYPKRTSKRYISEVDRDTGWDALNAAGFETVRLVAIDDDWSALRFRRKSYVGRKQPRQDSRGKMAVQKKAHG
jgi:hypothetical protein